VPTADCSGEGCTRYISISMIPGGNPEALSDPEKWATQYMRCAECGSYFCDRCLRKSRHKTSGLRCASCGGELYMPGDDEGLRMFAGGASQVLPPAIQELVDAGDEAGHLHDNREDAEALRRFLWVVEQYETLKVDDALSGELKKFTVREMMVRVLFWAAYGLLYRAMGGENGFWPERTSATDPALTRAATLLEECARMLNEVPALRRKVKPWSVHGACRTCQRLRLSSECNEE
jgi:hypothetical protein